MKKRLGFTLIEFLITLSIVIILAAVSVPIFTDLYQAHQLDSYIKNLQYVLQYARSEAVKNNTTVYVNFQTGDQWCYGVNSGSSCNCSIANNCTLGRYSAPSAQTLSLSTTGLTSNTLSFEGTHGATNVTSVLLFTIYGKSPNIGIKVTPLGNMQYCSSTYSEYNACS